jgi:hypothetical protein
MNEEKVYGGNNIKRQTGILLLLVVLLLSGCTGGKSGSGLTIAPYSVSEEEQALISKTGVGAIEYFKLDGKLAENEDLQFFMETYKDGKLTDDQVYSYGQVEKEFNQVLISFGVDQQEHQITFLNGFEDGLTERVEEIEGVSASSFTSFIEKKKKLIKNEDVYLTAWIGTKGSTLEGISLNEDGTLPDDLEGADAGYVFKMRWTDYKEE